MFVYAFDANFESRRARAQRILESADDVALRFPLQVVHEAFSTLTRRAKLEKPAVRQLLAGYIESIPVIEPRVTATLAAMDLSARHSVAFWDALIVLAPG